MKRGQSKEGAKLIVPWGKQSSISHVKRDSGFSLYKAHRPDYLRAEEVHEDKGAYLQ